MLDIQRFLESKKILVVDDESFTRNVLAGIIKHIGFKEVTEVRDVSAARIAMDNHSYDVCFCDWEMPGTSGIEFYEELKEDGILNNMVFIMITGHTEAEKVQEAIQKGITEYIAKPFSESIIRKKLIGVFCKKSAL